MAGRFRSRGPVFRFVKCFGKNFLENIFKKCIDFFPEIAYNEYNNKREVIEMLKTFYIYWGLNRVSCFCLKSIEQAYSIAKQYPLVTKIEERR